MEAPAAFALDSPADFSRAFNLQNHPADAYALQQRIDAGDAGYWENLVDRAGYIYREYPHPFAVRGITIAEGTAVVRKFNIPVTGYLWRSIAS